MPYDLAHVTLIGKSSGALCLLDQGPRTVKNMVRYINTQEQHHAKFSFEEEFRQILDRHGLAEFRG